MLRAVGIGFTLLVTLALSCCPCSRESLIQTYGDRFKYRSDIEDIEYQVLSTILRGGLPETDVVYFEEMTGIGPDTSVADSLQLVISNLSTANLSLGCLYRYSKLEHMSSLWPDLKATTFDDFAGKNIAGQRFEDKFDLPFAYYIIDKREERAYWEVGSGWDSFYKKFPRHVGITRLSRVGFDPDRTQALAYVGRQCLGLSGAGLYYFLRRDGDVWRVVGKYMAWIS